MGRGGRRRGTIDGERGTIDGERENKGNEHHAYLF